jgi:hypothetical protein
MPEKIIDSGDHTGETLVSKHADLDVMEEIQRLRDRITALESKL